MLKITLEENYKELGLLYRAKYPDCHKILASLTKVDEDGVSLGEKARVCINRKCWRYTDITKIKSWKRNMKYHEIIKALEIKQATI